MTAQVGNIVGFVDARESTAAASQDEQDSIANPQNYADTASLDARLQVIDAAYYTDARLANMVHNDKVMAVRFNDDNASIK